MEKKKGASWKYLYIMTLGISSFIDFTHNHLIIGLMICFILTILYLIGMLTFLCCELFQLYFCHYYIAWSFFYLDCYYLYHYKLPI